MPPAVAGDAIPAAAAALATWAAPSLWIAKKLPLRMPTRLMTASAPATAAATSSGRCALATCSSTASQAASVSGDSIADIEARYEGKGYADFKADLAEVVVDRNLVTSRKPDDVPAPEDHEVYVR